MKALKKVFTVIALLFVTGALFAQGTTEPEPLKITWQLIVAIVAGLYEVIARLIPTVANYSWLAKIIDILKWLSDFLNRKSKKSK